jgi:hypothetical protein
MRARYLLFAAGAVITSLLPQTSHAQLLFQVCRETCPDPLRDPVGAAACATRIELCESKLTAYNGYMTQLNAGVTTFTLPKLYRDLLQPFYSGSLANFRFGFGDRQPPSNATTDCSVTYFNNQSYVNALRNGTLDTNWRWLFHELRHFTQCNILGSRDAYAKMWFGHLELAFIQNNDLATLHDRMWMENDAETFAGTMLTNTEKMRDIHNRLVSPFVVTLLGPGGNVLPDESVFSIGTFTLTGKIAGGSDPVQRQWWVKNPLSSSFTRVQNGLSPDATSWQFMPTITGLWTVRLLVSQPGSNLPMASRQIVIRVSDAVRKSIQ